MANACMPIVVTEFGMVKVPVKLVQPLNAPIPILVTEFGIDKGPVNFSHIANASSPIEVREFGITHCVKTRFSVFSAM